MSRDEPHPRAGRMVRAAGHRTSGGHSPYRMRREPNALDPLHPYHHHKDAQMDFVEFPKWLHFDGEPSVKVDDAEEEAAVLSARAKPKRARKADAPDGAETPEA